MNKFLIFLFSALGALSVQAQGYSLDDLKNMDMDALMEHMDGVLNKMQNAQENVKYDNTYTFTLFSKLRTDVTSKGKTETILMDFYSATDANMMNSSSIDMENSNVIIDSKNKTMITLDEAKKTGVAMSLEGFGDMLGDFTKNYQNNTSNENTTKIVKTGNTKTILGYKCEEYFIKDSDKEFPSETTAWITNDANISYLDFFSALSKQIPTIQQPKNIKGITLEMVSKDLKTGDITSLKVLELSKKTTTKNLSTYKISTGF